MQSCWGGSLSPTCLTLEHCMIRVDGLVARRTTNDDYKWRFSLVYVEIYNERVKDLLNPMSGCDLDVREDARKGTHVAGAVEVAVASLQEIMELMNKGNLYRTTEATNCNEVSSRSHAVLQVNCVGVEKFPEVRRITSSASCAAIGCVDGAESSARSHKRVRLGGGYTGERASEKAELASLTDRPRG